MKLERSITLKIGYILDNWIPPVIRDSKVFMMFPFYLLFKEKRAHFFSFKDRAFSMSHEEISKTYEVLSDVHISRETDLNLACEQKILSSIEGNNILEVGCGRGYLAERLEKTGQLTACDMHISDELSKKFPHIQFETANIEALPYKDNAFDTVVCTHTLEHVVDLVAAIKELRRVTRKRLIIVVPKQRPYRYTFDLHIHFFPYAFSVQAFLGDDENKRLEELDGDWYFQEELA